MLLQRRQRGTDKCHGRGSDLACLGGIGGGSGGGGLTLGRHLAILEYRGAICNLLGNPVPPGDPILHNDPRPIPKAIP